VDAVEEQRLLLLLRVYLVYHPPYRRRHQIEKCGPTMVHRRRYHQPTRRLLVEAERILHGV
jgi:hypothetical protein